MRIIRSLFVIAGLLAPASLAADSLSAGGYHAVRIDGGSVRGLGDGTYGQLGINPAGTPAIVTGLDDMTSVAAGGFSTLTLKNDGTVWFLGESTVQFTTPHGTPDPALTPVQIAGLSGIDEIAAGHRHFLALDTDTGNLFAWGHNGSGQVGNGGLQDVSVPALVLTGVATMSAGDGFSLAVKSDNTVWAWGRNAHGQLGLGDTADRLTPTQITGLANAETVAAGGQHSLILLTNGSVRATGNNAFGQLGLGTTNSTVVLLTVPGLSGITQITAGYFHSGSLGPGGQISFWGRNFEGQCGGGAGSPVTFLSPQIMTGLTGVPVAITCGYHFTLVPFADGSLAGFGSNSDGQLDGMAVADQGDSQKVLTPQLVPLTPDVTPPSPNPMSFASVPSAFSATTINMVATSATDLSGPVEYFFDCLTPGGNDSDWQLEEFYQDTGLTAGVQYTYQVKARDASGNETAFSPSSSAIPADDLTAPNPNPMSFAVAPTALGAGSITMTASTASDLNGVEYQFQNTSGGGHDSGWQDSPTYVDSGLAPATTYTYRVRARDRSPNQNTTAFSGSASATTETVTVILATDFTGRTVSGKTASSVTWTVGGIVDPGDLTAFDESPTNGNFTTLFDTNNAQGHFAPDKNVGNEGPWSVAIPLVLTSAQIQIEDVVIDWQHFSNTGDFQTASRSVNWTVSVTGTSSGLLGSSTASAVSGISGQETLVFSPPLTLRNTETFTFKILATGSDNNGNNTGLDGFTINGSASGPVTPAAPSLLAHYRFDVEAAGTTPDAISSNFATLGGAVAINPSVPGRIGSGALEMTQTGSGFAAGGDGAVTSNSFLWADDARTITFWWKAKTPNVDTTNGTFLSFGDTTANGNRFDVKETATGGNSLRVEIQGIGGNSSPPNFDDGSWHFVAVTVPDAATFADVSWFVDGSSMNLNSSTSGLEIATGMGPLVFGDSIITGSATDDRSPNGYLDDFQLYDRVLTQAEISFLFTNPGSVIGGGSADFEAYISDPDFGLPIDARGFEDDPDGDGLANGIEAWLGTHPGEFNAGLSEIVSNGTVISFTHPQNENLPGDVSVEYQWSPNLIDWYPTDGTSGPLNGPAISVVSNTIGSATTVTANASEPIDHLFFRIQVMLLPAP